MHNGGAGISHYIVRTSPNDAGVRVPAARRSHTIQRINPLLGITVSVSAEGVGGSGVSASTHAQRANTRVFRPSDATWHGRGDPTIIFGRRGDIPVPGDYDGDGLSEPAVFRPTDGSWVVRGSNNSVRFGRPGDVPVPADYNGDGIVERAVFRPAEGRWFVDGIGSVRIGAPGDIPVPADYTGDGAAEVAVFRPGNGVWYFGSFDGNWLNQGILRTGSSRRFGTRGDIPVPGDWNGDGTVELSVFRPATGTWFRPGLPAVQLGQRTDVPIAGDFNVDGRTDIGVFRPATATWYLAGVGRVFFGRHGDNRPSPVREVRR